MPTRSKVEYRPLRSDDVGEVLNLKLRASDIEEIHATSGLAESREIVAHCLKHSVETWVVVYEGCIEALFGLGMAKDKSYAIPWFIATDRFREFAFACGREARVVIQGWRKHHTLRNFVCAHHKESLRWLRWLGFVVEDRVRYSFKNNPTLPFHEFYAFKEVPADV